MYKRDIIKYTVIGIITIIPFILLMVILNKNTINPKTIIVSELNDNQEPVEKLSNVIDVIKYPNITFLTTNIPKGEYKCTIEYKSGKSFFDEKQFVYQNNILYNIIQAELLPNCEMNYKICDKNNKLISSYKFEIINSNIGLAEFVDTRKNLLNSSKIGQMFIATSKVKNVEKMPTNIIQVSSAIEHLYVNTLLVDMENDDEVTLIISKDGQLVKQKTFHTSKSVASKWITLEFDTPLEIGDYSVVATYYGEIIGSCNVEVVGADSIE